MLSRYVLFVRKPRIPFFSLFFGSHFKLAGPWTATSAFNPKSGFSARVGDYFGALIQHYKIPAKAGRLKDGDAGAVYFQHIDQTAHSLVHFQLSNDAWNALLLLRQARHPVKVYDYWSTDDPIEELVMYGYARFTDTTYKVVQVTALGLKK